MKKFLYTIIQCTWGILQTIIGLILFLVNIKKEHYNYLGAIVTEWNYSGCVSLGLFIFISKDSGIYKKGLIVHEYGHTIQSLILGFLYVPIILIPSLIWCGLPYFKNYRKIKNVSYYSMYTESWANSLGESITGEKSVR